MVTCVTWNSGLVETVKVTCVAPAGTVTLAGTVAAAVLLLVSVTTAPPVGAGLASVRVAVEELPEIRLDGFRVRLENTAAVPVRREIPEKPPAHPLSASRK